MAEPARRLPGFVEVDGRRTPVVGTELDGPQRDRFWQVLNEQATDYASYQANVSRQLAVVALTPATSSIQA